MTEPTRYAGYVVPEVSQARVESQWARIAEQLPAPRTARRFTVGPLTASMTVGVALAAAVALFWTYSPRTSESVWEGSVVASDDAPVNFTLPEGTLIELDPRSEVRLMRSNAKAVQVSLSEGSARFDVAKKRSRRFSVQMGQVEVLVTGTQFRLSRSMVDGGERVRVVVEEGSVEVQRAGVGAVALQAGDHWSAFVPEEESVAPDADNEALDSSTDEVEEAESEQVESDDDAADEQAPAPRRTRRNKRARAQAEAAAAAELFDEANVARRAGRVADAAKLYGELAQRHPRDKRAALAAFELGRIRMDSLADVAGAVEALDRALKLDARRAFAEDALARLVSAHEALGDRPACLKARERYLARYPEGVHASHVSVRCGAN